MAYIPPNPNGQADMANSAPVVVASNQTAVPVKTDQTVHGTTDLVAADNTKIAGTAIDTDSGVKSAGTQRVVLATDQPQLTNALKVDGSAVTQPISVASLPTPTGAALDATLTSGTQITKLSDGTDTALITAAGEQNVIATAQPGVDIGDVTVNNAAGASAVNIQDGGNTITVDGAAATLKVDAALVGGIAPNLNTGTASTGTQRVVLATDQAALTNNILPAWTVYSQNALTTTVTVSSAAGRFGGAQFINLNTYPAYIQVFNTTGAVTLGTTTPTFVIPIPANYTATNGSGFVMMPMPGITMSAGIKVAATTTATGAATVTTGLTGYVLYA